MSVHREGGRERKGGVVVSGYIDENGDFVLVNQQDDPSDYDQLLEDIDAAGRNSRGFVSDIQKAATLSRLKQRENGAEAAAVNISPLSVIRSGDPKLGDRAVCTAGGASNEVVRWAGDINETRACTLSIGIMNIGASGAVVPVSGTPALRAFAVINYGTRNFTQTIVVDVGKGSNFSFAASWVNVSVGLELPSGGTAGSVDIGASLGFGGSGGSCPVTRTVYIDTPIAINPGASPSATTSTPVPVGAKQLLPIQRAFVVTAGTPPVLTPVAFMIDFFAFDGTTIVATLYGGDTVYSAMSSPLPLPNDAYSFRVTNMDAVVGHTIPSMRLVFQLGF